LSSYFPASSWQNLPNDADRLIPGGVLQAIGNTPLVELTRVASGSAIQVFGKLEYLNPAGSVKDRAAFSILVDAIEQRKVTPETVIVESSSGNMGIALAQACAYLHLRFLCVVDARTSAQNLDILKTYGAELHLISEPDPETGEFLHARIKAVKSLLSTIPNSYWPNQYANQTNCAAHYRTTMPEIVHELGRPCDFFFCAVSTCGTIVGCAQAVREESSGTKIIAVDAAGSAIFRPAKGPRRIPGHGAPITPDLLRPELIDRCVHVSDEDCVRGCRWLLKREAILAGGSSGAVVAALEALLHDIPAKSTCVLLFADRGERYLDTVYSDAWVELHFPGLLSSMEWGCA
jgi:N-(2-amino-2-carboxyethyl)-L-glutamate synthase